ncbi:hypothetical protein FRAHR75_460064 [Frankia sp. Hr75.2]|nr:hypothetical protein FRAHR75_460064 [Frankia sp. Hr75.2]
MSLDGDTRQVRGRESDAIRVSAVRLPSLMPRRQSELEPALLNDHPHTQRAPDIPRLSLHGARRTKGGPEFDPRSFPRASPRSLGVATRYVKLRGM